MRHFNTTNVDPSWQPLISEALSHVDSNYLAALADNTDWLPGRQHIFQAFTLPLSQTRYILFGESPYPRPASAIGYAFWDGAVGNLWSPEGLSKQVNRATSLRNLIKMLLVARGDLSKDTSQPAITQVDKHHLVRTATDFFTNFQQEGFLLLNATPVLRKNFVKQDAKAWLPFVNSLLCQLEQIKPDLTLVLFGKIAQVISKLDCTKNFKQFQSEHPYNISFIHNQTVLDFFQPFDLLRQR